MTTTVKTDGIASVKPQYGFEEIRKKINFDNSFLNWKQEKAQLAAKIGENYIDIPGGVAIIRTDAGLPLGEAKENYRIIQTEDIWNLAHEALDGQKFEIVSSGCCMKSRLVFLQAEIEGANEFFVGNDAHKNFLILSSRTDGGGALKVYNSSLRLACKNQLNISEIKKGSIDFRVLHKGDTEFNIKGLTEEIQNMLKETKAFYKQMEKLREQRITLDRAEKLFLGFEFQDAEKPEEVQLSTRARNKNEQILNIFSVGPGNSGESLYDAVQAVSDFYTNRTHRNNPLKRLESSLFGLGNTRKASFVRAIFDKKETDKLVHIGSKILANQSKAIVLVNN